MKLGSSITVFTGDTRQRPQTEQTDKAKNGVSDGKNKTFYAGNFLVEFPLKDRIEQRKAQAQERAMKIVNDAWDGDKRLDKEIEARREHIQELKEDNKEMLEMFGPELGSLMIGQNLATISEESRVISAIRKERLKYHNMVDAQEQAEDVIEASRDEIIGMVMEEAKEHVDEEQEKREDQAEAIEEKKEEQEEILKKRDEKEEELEKLMEEMPVEESVDVKQTVEEVKRQVQRVLNEVSLIEEDIKGSRVDMEL